MLISLLNQILYMRNTQLSASWINLYASVFVSGLATIMAEDANIELEKKFNTKFKQQVNNSVLFHSIKNKIIHLMFNPPADFQEQIKALFLLNPSLLRPDRFKLHRYDPRSGPGKKRSLFYQKYLRKHVF